MIESEEERERRGTGECGNECKETPDQRPDWWSLRKKERGEEVG